MKVLVQGARSEKQLTTDGDNAIIEILLTV